MRWTVVKADQTRKKEPKEEKTAERVSKSEGELLKKTADKGMTPVETESDETRVISDREGGTKGEKEDK